MRINLGLKKVALFLVLRLNLHENLVPRGKINMQLKKISRSAQHTLKTILHNENVEYKLMETEKIARQKGITQEKNINLVIRRVVM